MGYIYKITNTTNNKVYIGQTVRGYSERWAEHKRDKDKKPYCNWPLYRMLNQVDSEKIVWEVIEELPNEDLNEREKYWISFYDSKNNGYNCTEGGTNGTKHDYNEILYYWLEKGERNFTKTAQHFNTSKSYISKIIYSLGFEARSWSEINKINNKDRRRKVNQIDKKSGKVLRTFESLTEAAKYMGDTSYVKAISSTCKGRHPTYLGYCWQYIEDIGKPICLNKQQNIIILPDKGKEFSTLNDCAKWFIDSGLTRSKKIERVASSIRYALNHSGHYQRTLVKERKKEIISYYGD